MLRNIPSSELAEIINGKSPNPILDTPPVDLENNTLPMVEPLMENPQADGIPVYQHSMHDLLKRQLSSKRKRRTVSDGKQQEVDKDVVEMLLDTDSFQQSDMSGDDDHDFASTSNTFKSPIYPAMLLNDNQQRQRRGSAGSSLRPALTESSTWSHGDQSGDYFGADAIKATSKCK